MRQAGRQAHSPGLQLQHEHAHSNWRHRRGLLGPTVTVTPHSRVVIAEPK